MKDSRDAHVYGAYLRDLLKNYNGMDLRCPSLSRDDVESSSIFKVIYLLNIMQIYFKTCIDNIIFMLQDYFRDWLNECALEEANKLYARVKNQVQGNEVYLLFIVF